MFRFGIFAVVLISASVYAAMPQTHPLPEFPLKANDRVFWYGSSSTMIGVWPRTLEFLLRTRHPDLPLKFERRGVGGGSFTMAVREISGILEKSKPTVVFFNFGGNDATRGPKGLPLVNQVMAEAVSRVKASGARPILLTPQPGDERMAGARNDYLGLYAKEMLKFAREESLLAMDTYQPLEDMQNFRQNEVSDFTINKDRIHLTDSAYVAWGFFIYEGLNPPAAESSVELLDGKVVSAVNCSVSSVKASAHRVEFVREDKILPMLPPHPIPVTINTAPTKALAAPVSSVSSYAEEHWSELPPRQYCPLEKHSRYMLKIGGLEDGVYLIEAEGKPLGTASAAQLKEGVNINSLLLDSGHAAPWDELVLELWAGKSLNKIGKTKFKFDVHKKD